MQPTAKSDRDEPRPVKALAVTLYLGVVGVYAYFTLAGIYPTPAPGWGGPAILVGVLGMAGLDRLEVRFQHQKPARFVPALLLVARAGIIVLFSLSDGLGSIPEPYLLLLLFFSFFLMTGRTFGLTGLVWLLYLLMRVHIVTDTHEPPPWRGGAHNLIRDLTFVVVILLTLAFILSMAYQAKRERAHRLRVEKLLHELEDSHRQLQASAEQATELATLAERNRLAREIHDSLGHYMTVINVQLEKAIVFRNRDSGQADQAVRDAKRLAGEALADIRRSVGALRDSAQPFCLAEALAGLAAPLRSNGLVVELEVTGSEAGFSSPALQTLYRAVQEGLTNVQKHAGAGRVAVRVQLEAQAARLSIEDDGRGFDPAEKAAAPGEHYGLRGVRERLELAGGSLEVKSSPGQGTRLLVTIPKKPPAVTGTVSGE